MQKARLQIRKAGPSRSIPSLDGMRAIAVMMVILGHSSWFFPASIRANSLFSDALGNGGNGVAIFFVLSGFLITDILLKEFEKTQKVSLKRFYFRRSLRIFPAFYFYLAVMGMLWAFHRIPEQPGSFAISATYLWSCFPHAQGYFIQHTWSLSVEEIFYLFWPALLVLLHNRSRAVTAAATVVIAMPIVRILVYLSVPSLRGMEYYMVYGWLDTMMVGCLLALLRRRPAFQRWKNWILNGWTVAGMAFFVFYANVRLKHWMHSPYRGFYDLGFSPFLASLCIAGVLLYVIENADSPVGWILNHPVIRRIGVMSYSLYLWQQLFLSQELRLLPLGYVFLLLTAVFSFYVIEQPCLRLRTVMEQRWKKHRDNLQTAEETEAMSAGTR